MRFHNCSVKAKEDTTVDFSWINATAEALERGKGEQGGEARQRRIVEGFAQQIADQAGGAFARF